MYVYTHACIYVCLNVCMYVYTYICMYVCMHACIYIYIYMHVCMFLEDDWILVRGVNVWRPLLSGALGLLDMVTCMYVCIYVCMHVCYGDMYVCMYVSHG